MEQINTLQEALAADLQSLLSMIDEDAKEMSQDDLTAASETVGKLTIAFQALQDARDEPMESPFRVQALSFGQECHAAFTHWLQ